MNQQMTMKRTSNNTDTSLVLVMPIQKKTKKTIARPKHDVFPKRNPEDYPCARDEFHPLNVIPAEIWVYIFTMNHKVEDDNAVSLVCTHWNHIRKGFLHVAARIPRLVKIKGKTGHSLLMEIEHVLDTKSIGLVNQVLIYNTMGEDNRLGDNLTSSLKKMAIHITHKVVLMEDSDMLRNWLVSIGRPKPAFWDVTILRNLLQSPNITGRVLDQFVKKKMHTRIKNNNMAEIAIKPITIEAIKWLDRYREMYFPDTGALAYTLLSAVSYSICWGRNGDTTMIKYLKAHDHWNETLNHQAWKIIIDRLQKDSLPLLDAPSSDQRTLRYLKDILGTPTGNMDKKVNNAELIKIREFMKAMITKINKHSLYIDGTARANRRSLVNVCVGDSRTTFVIQRLEMLHDYIGGLTNEERSWKSPILAPYEDVQEPEVFKWLWNHGYAIDSYNQRLVVNSSRLRRFWEKAVHLNVAVWLMNTNAFNQKKTLDAANIVGFLRMGQYSLLEMIYAKTHQLVLIEELSCKTFFDKVNNVITFAQIGCHDYIPTSVEEDMSGPEKAEHFKLHMKACHKLKSWLRYFKIHNCNGTCKQACIYCGGELTPNMNQ